MHTHEEKATMDFYQRLRSEIREWSGSEGRLRNSLEWIMLAPDLFHLMLRLSADPRVAGADKIRLAAVIAYFITPLDLLPELFMGPSGFLEDVVLAVYALNAMISHTDISIIREHWAGKEDVLEIIYKVLSHTDRLLDSGMIKKLKKMVR